MIRKIFGMLLIFIFFIGNNSKASKNIGNTDLFDEILKNTQGKVIEYGVSTSFKIQGDIPESIHEILRNMNVQEIESEFRKNEDYIYIGFLNGSMSGNLTCSRDKNIYSITITSIDKNRTDNLKELKQKISQAVRTGGGALEFYEYLKIGLTGGDIKNINNKICGFLKTKGAVNLKTVKINNGFSTIAYTKAFDQIKNNGEGKFYDFNFAICNYTSGVYLILGTPEITTAY